MTKSGTPADLLNQPQEHLLEWLNAALAPLEAEVIKDAMAPRLPTVFVVGAPRAGTTLLAQLLASTGALAYVNNFVARFWSAPVVGALIDKALRVSGGTPSLEYDSKFGTTAGWSGPHEFGYFWRRWLPVDDADATRSQQGDADVGELLRELYGLEQVYDKPLFFKNLRCTLHIPFLAATLPRAQFVLVRRNPLFNAQSILLMRQAKYGNQSEWGPIRPKEYSKLASRSPAEQAVGQVYYLLKEAKSALAQLDESRYLEIQYEGLCAQPTSVVSSIFERVFTDASQAAYVASAGSAGKRFESKNFQRVPDGEFSELQALCRKYFGTPVS